MGDDLLTSLDSYKLQLTQVEAALTSDPSNDELLKLQTDLREVIQLTEELLSQTQEPGTPPQASSASSSYEKTSGGTRNPEDWKVGDKCLAPWSQDSKYYEALIEEIHPGGQVSIGFTAYSHGDVCHISLLRTLGSGIPGEKEKDHKKGGTGSSSTSVKGVSSSTGASTARRVGPKETLAERKAALLKQKEYLKKRKQKKLARVQEQEQEREKDKKKWINFSTKKGLLKKGKKSIFASPETVDGRVGVGTCGVAGKGMTEFSAADKWKRGWKK